ncbi:MAG: dTDP-4-dehydrorhamnose reductase [Candidatus Coatesbacteria bacterium]|nr:dTDP-4-dehydrorhamnose reductase [Candidatus Coatesbacteria bacterium]
MRRILVIGAKGMLGRDLCARLRQDFKVLEADIDEVDITDFTSTRELVAGISPDEVVNVAAFTDVDGAEGKAWLAYEINAEGARNVAKASRAVGSRCTYIGTDFIFDGKKRSPYVEDDAPNPMCVYAKSKLAGELYVQHHADRHLIVRTAWLFGLHGKNFVEAILTRAAVGNLRVVEDQVGCPTFSVDLSEALARLLKTNQTGVFHCTNYGSCSWFDFAEAIVAEAGLRNVEVSPISSTELNRPAPRPPYSVLANSKLRRAIGFRMPAWQDALRRYMRLRNGRMGG